MPEIQVLQESDFRSTLDKKGLGQLLFELADKFEDNICQIDATVDVMETYSSVKKRSTRLAVSLQKRGVTSKDIIVTCSYNNNDNSIPVLAALYLGAKIANLDPTLSVRSTKHLLNLVSPKIIFVEQSSIELIEKSLKDTDLKTEIIVLGNCSKYSMLSDLVAPNPLEEIFKPVEVDIHDTAVLFFSSGTTGLPKPIAHSHYSFLQIAEIMIKCGVNPNSMLHFTTFYWISGMMILVTMFLQGGTRIFSRDTSGANTYRLIEKYKISSIFMAPIYTYSLTSVKNPKKYDTSSLRSILTGGTPISPKQFRKLSDLFENADIVFGYGMSEVGMISLFNPHTERHLIKTKIGSCGRVAPKVSLKVVDPNNETLLGPNKKGEIRVTSPGMMKGYHNQDSSDCFDKNGFLKTGDIGYYDEDGCLYVIERMKEMFKYQSWHIVPSCIEAVLLEHPAVQETVVLGIPVGEEGDIPAACVVLKENLDADKEEIEKFVEERVSDKEKLRGGVIFLKSLPKTPSGKVSRIEARNIAVKMLKI